MWTFYKIDNHLQISNTHIPALAFFPDGENRTLFRYEHALIPLDSTYSILGPGRSRHHLLRLRGHGLQPGGQANVPPAPELPLLPQGIQRRTVRKIPGNLPAQGRSQQDIFHPAGCGRPQEEIRQGTGRLPDVRPDDGRGPGHARPVPAARHAAHRLCAGPAEKGRLYL